MGVSEMRKENQMIVNFTDEDTVRRLSELGEIDYRSKVLNVLFLTTIETYHKIYTIKGVTFVKQVSGTRLRNNKERSWYY